MLIPLLQRHSDPRLNPAWTAIQLGLLALPIAPILGAIGLVGGIFLGTYAKGGALLQRPLNRALSVLALGFSLMVFGAVNRMDALLGLANFLPYFWLLAVYSEILQTPTQLRQVATLLVWPSLPIVLIGLGELFLGWHLPQGILTILVPGPLAAYGTPPGRMSSTLTYANVLACYLSVIFVLALGFWAQAYRQRQEGRSQRHWLGLWTGVVALNSVGLVLTQSRSAWGVAVAAALGFALYLGWRSLVLFVLGLVGTVFWSAFGPVGRAPLRQVIPRYFWARLTDELYPDRPVGTLRATQWNFALDLIHHRPWTGWGLRNFSSLYEAKTQIWMGHPHNLFLMLAAETGIPVMLGLIIIVGWIVHRGIHLFYKQRKIVNAPDLCVFFSILMGFLSCVTFHCFDVPLFDFRINVLGWIFLSMILGVVYSSNAGNIDLGGYEAFPVDQPKR